MSGRTEIQEKYEEFRQLLGAALSEPQAAGDGLVCVYEHGRIYWSPASGAHEVHGGILERYLSMDGPTGILGFPETDEMHTKRGCPNSMFQHGAIYWTKPGGACVTGVIYEHKLKSGIDNLPVGYPVSDTITKSGGELVYCQFGAIWLGKCQINAAVVPVLFDFCLTPPKTGRPKIFNMHTPEEMKFSDLLSWNIVNTGEYDLAKDAMALPNEAEIWNGILKLVPVSSDTKPEVSFTVGDTARPSLPGTNAVSLYAQQQNLRERTLYNLAYSLPDGTEYEVMPHCYYTNGKWSNFGFLHITDLHISRRIDGYVAKLDAKGAENLNNNNNNFRSFIRYANDLHDNGNVDFILATGDIVDYLFEDDDDRRYGGNWSFFKELIKGNAPSPEGCKNEELRVPIFTVLGNHEYRPNPYPLLFTLDMPWPADNKTVQQYSNLNLLKNEALLLQNGSVPLIEIEGKNSLLEKVLYSDPENKTGALDWYHLWMNDDKSYVLELRSDLPMIHKIVMLNTGWDTDLPTSTRDAIGHYIWGNEDEKNAMEQQEPPSAGIFNDGLDLVKNSLSHMNGLRIVCMHAPAFNICGNESPHYIRETEHAAADRKELEGFADRAGDMDNWKYTIHNPYFIYGGVDNGLDRCTVKKNADAFLKTCLGINTQRKADLVLCGHAHKRPEFRLEWIRNTIHYFTDFYTENPSRYYNSKKAGYSSPVAIHVVPGAPLGSSVIHNADHRSDAVWKESLSLHVPPYANPLNSAADKQAWWDQHRPLFLQTAPLGPMDINQRKDTSVNKTPPAPPFQGCRLISVKDNTIHTIKNVTVADIKLSIRNIKRELLEDKIIKGKAIGSIKSRKVHKKTKDADK